MLARASSATPWGIEALSVEVEVDVQNGLPQMQIVGLADAAVRESRERVRAAIRNCGLELPPRAVVVNLAPADIKKSDNHLDLAIALALLVALGQLPPESLEDRIFAGELGLDGTIRPVRGALAIAHLAERLEARELVLPAANAGEAACLDRLPIVGLASFAQAVAHLAGTDPRPPAAPSPFAPDAPRYEADLSEVRGQEAAKRCLEIAAAGAHNALLIGPPGSGKTMLARRLPTLMPPLTLGESIEITKIHSLVAERPLSELVRRRPFRSPHASTSTAALVGGGSIPRPGEVTLAHGGTLFLDELPEFRRDALEALRQPLEEARVTVVRARARLTFPASFSLVAAMNPCPCGHLGDPRQECRCTPGAIERYRGKISGPLLDRIDLHVEVPAVTLGELRGAAGEGSAAVRDRVCASRSLQERRFGSGERIPANAFMTPGQVLEACRLGGAARALLDRAFECLGLSARGVDRVLKVGRTIADLAGSPTIESAHLAEAIQYRSLDRRVTAVC